MHHFEGYPFIHGKTNKNFIDRAIKYFNKSNTLFITSMRDPIERIISQYNFEWRWGCVGGKTKCNYTHRLLEENDNKITEKNYAKIINDTRNISDSAKYKYTNIPLSDIMARVETIEMKQNYFKGDAKSIYLNNYYLWLFCCDTTECSRNFYIDNNNKWKLNCLNHAKEIMENKIDIILITEWMNDMRIPIFVNTKINELLKKSGFNDNIDILQPTTRNVKATRDLRAKRNEGTLKMISNDGYNKLLKWNELDLEFYEYTKQISYNEIRYSDTNWLA